MSKNNLTNEAFYLNQATYIEIVQDLMLMTVSRYEWFGLPKEIDYRFLEYILTTNGVAIFFYDDVLQEYACLQCTYGGMYDIYQIPTDRRAYAVNGYNKKLDETDSVFIFNNFLRTSEMPKIINSAKRIYETQRAIDVNVKGQKTPIIIRCDEKQRLTLRNLYMKYDGNVPFIFADKQLDLDSMKVLKTDSPFVSDKLEDLKKTQYNDFYTKIGVSNSNITKRERVNTDEVTTNLGSVEMHKQLGLIARQQACEQINEMFGLKVSVKFRDIMPKEYLGDGDMEYEETEDEELERSEE